MTRHVTSEHAQYAHNQHGPEFTDQNLVGENQDHAISWDQEVVST